MLAAVDMKGGEVLSETILQHDYPVDWPSEIFHAPANYLPIYSSIRRQMNFSVRDQVLV